jgi:hypothetical protein
VPNALGSTIPYLLKFSSKLRKPDRDLYPGAPVLKQIRIARLPCVIQPLGSCTVSLVPKLRRCQHPTGRASPWLCVLGKLEVGSAHNGLCRRLGHWDWGKASESHPAPLRHSSRLPCLG